jgi:hypothetical protein
MCCQKWRNLRTSSVPQFSVDYWKSCASIDHSTLFFLPDSETSKENLQMLCRQSFCIMISFWAFPSLGTEFSFAFFCQLSHFSTPIFRSVKCHSILQKLGFICGSPIVRSGLSILWPATKSPLFFFFFFFFKSHSLQLNGIHPHFTSSLQISGWHSPRLPANINWTKIFWLSNHFHSNFPVQLFFILRLDVL